MILRSFKLKCLLYILIFQFLLFLCYFIFQRSNQKCKKDFSKWRDLEADPIVIIISNNSGGFEEQFSNDLQEVRDDGRSCEVPCYSTKNEEKYKSVADAYFSYQNPQPPKVFCDGAKTVYYTMENTPKDSVLYDIVIDTRNAGADITQSYGWYPGYNFWRAPRNKTAKSMACAFISNCDVVSSNRFEVLKELMSNGVTVDSFGNCMNNAKEPVIIKNDRAENKKEIMSTYKFSLAFENSIGEGYITEKFFQSLEVGTVPIVLGAPNIRMYFPSENAGLVVHEFQSIKELSERIKFLSENEEEYQKMLAWKKDGPSDTFLASLDDTTVHFWCRLCTKLADLRSQIPRYFPQDAILVRERNKFRYRPIRLTSVPYTITELKEKVLEAFENPKGGGGVYEPAFAAYRRWSKKLVISRIVDAGLRNYDALTGPHYDSDEMVRKLIPGQSKLEVIFK